MQILAASGSVRARVWVDFLQTWNAGRLFCRLNAGVARANTSRRYGAAARPGGAGPVVTWAADGALAFWDAAECFAAGGQTPTPRGVAEVLDEDGEPVPLFQCAFDPSGSHLICGGGGLRGNQPLGQKKCISTFGYRTGGGGRHGAPDDDAVPAVFVFEFEASSGGRKRGRDEEEAPAEGGAAV